jgi:hypothetical protein
VGSRQLPTIHDTAYPRWIDKNLQLGLDVIREVCNEEKEAELRANSPKLFADMQTSMEELKRTLAPRSAAAPERRVP